MAMHAEQAIVDRNPATGHSGTRSGWAFADLHNSATAWVILGLSALVTIAAWYISHHSVLRVAETRFAHKVHDIQTAIDARMKEQEFTLWGGVGLFYASDEVTRQEWRKYAEALRLDIFQPGLQGFGYAKLITNRDKDTQIGQVRNEGFPDFDIYPGGERDTYSPVIYLEPFAERNLRAFGYDMWSEPTRRAAMQLARDTGEAAVSGKVVLVQETGDDVQRGFLMYIPVYRAGAPTSTIDERRAALDGFVYSPFRIKDLMIGILGKEDTEIDFRIYDGDRQTNDELLYDSAGDYTLSAVPDSHDFHATRILRPGGHLWTLEFRNRPGFITSNESNEPLIVAAGGILIDILLFLTITSLSNQRRRSQEIAAEMTDELRSAKNLAERAAEAEMVLRTEAQDSNAKLQSANQGLLRFTSIVAHDLRAPLKRIEAFIDILRKDYGDRFDEDGRDILSRIDRGSSRMRLMLDSLHNYSRHSNVCLDGKTARMADVIDHAIETLRGECKTLKIAVDVEKDTRVLGDAHLLEHVVQNLIGNSIKFRSDGEPEISVSAEATADDTVEVAVADNGIGIPDEYAGKVFDMFTRLHDEDEFEGTGIGLAICKKIVTDHGGDIWIDPGRAKGTRVVMALRRADRQKPANPG